MPAPVRAVYKFEPSEQPCRSSVVLILSLFLFLFWLRDCLSCVTFALLSIAKHDVSATRRRAASAYDIVFAHAFRPVADMHRTQLSHCACATEEHN